MYYLTQPDCCCAVTGTNGKSSVAYFLSQLWPSPSARLGNMGLFSPITPNMDPSTFSYPHCYGLDNFYCLLSELANLKVQRVVFEAFSFFLKNHFFDRLKLSVTAFTNLSPDHMKFHNGDVEDYFQAKSRLFTDFDAYRVINADCPYGKRILETLNYQQCLWYGKSKRYPLYYDEYAIYFFDQRVSLRSLPSQDEHMIQNLLCAIGMALITGVSTREVASRLPRLQMMPGRMEKVRPNLYIDFAHNPAGLLAVLKSLYKTNRNILLGVGLDQTREPLIRPEMMQIACSYAKRVWVTDNQHPKEIRDQIQKACPTAIELPNWDQLIGTVLENAVRGDVVLFAGWGSSQSSIGQQGFAGARNYMIDGIERHIVRLYELRTKTS